jgi:hypothetical protein
MARLAQRAIARIQENRPVLRGKSLEQTMMILQMEERLRRPKVSSGDSDNKVASGANGGVEGK